LKKSSEQRSLSDEIKNDSQEINLDEIKEEKAARSIESANKKEKSQEVVIGNLDEIKEEKAARPIKKASSKEKSQEVVIGNLDEIKEEKAARPIKKASSKEKSQEVVIGNLDEIKEEKAARSIESANKKEIRQEIEIRNLDERNSSQRSKRSKHSIRSASKEIPQKKQNTEISVDDHQSVASNKDINIELEDERTNVSAHEEDRIEMKF
jgi:hypothetical protein